jgi:periplasmic protein TonB
MKFQRFILPALLAAALHAVLLFALPVTETDVIIHPPASRLVQLPAMPRFPVEPPEEPPVSTAPVRPVNASSEGGPPRPTLPENYTRQPASFDMDGGPSPVVLTDSVTLVPPGASGPGAGPAQWGPGGTTWIDANLLDRAPRARAQPSPDYPPTLRRELVEGEVLVELDVDAQGRVAGARVLAADHREFADSALRAVLRWRFEPGRRDGRAVAFRLRLPVGFRLTGD